MRDEIGHKVNMNVFKFKLLKVGEKVLQIKTLRGTVSDLLLGSEIILYALVIVIIVACLIE